MTACPFSYRNGQVIEVFYRGVRGPAALLDDEPYKQNLPLIPDTPFPVDCRSSLGQSAEDGIRLSPISVDFGKYKV